MLITIFLVSAPIEPIFASSITPADTIQVQGNGIDKTGYVSQSKIDDAMLGTVQLPFIENIGQASDQVKYYANTFAGTVFVTKNSITYSLHKDVLQDSNLEGLAIKEKFLGAQTLNPMGLQKSESVVNYFVGDNEKWKSNVPTYNDISLGQLWPSIDVSLKAHGNNIEKIFTVHPGGDVNNIRLESDGITSIQVSSDGKLMLDTQLGIVSMTKPTAFQYIDGMRKDIPVSYYVDGTTYGFALGPYDQKYDLVIDPLLASTFIGGSGDDFAREIAIDSGNVYVAGYSESSNYPATAGTYNQTHGAGPDVFVSKLDSSLGTLIASTFIGGNGIDFVYALTVDSGNVYVAGRTESSDFPVTTGAYDQTYGGNSDAYVSKLDSSLGHLLASTFIGGSGFDSIRALVIDSGNVFVAGRTGSFDFPVTTGAYNTTPPPNFDGFVSKLDSSLGSLLASTFIGKDGNNIIYDLAVNSGNVYVTGQAISSNFPVTAGAYDQTYNGGAGGDTFVSKLDSSLGNLLASTYLGGNGDDIPRALVIDSGNVYVAGHTNSSNYPVTAGAYDTTYNGADNGAPADGDGGSGDVFVSKLDSSLGNLLASTYLGGSGNDLDFALAVNSGNVYVAGTTDSPNYPVTAGAYDRTFNVGGSPEAFVSKLDSSLGNLLASTYLGGSSDDLIRALVIDSGNVYVAGRTNSPDYPVTAGAYDQTYIGAYDVFVSKLDSCLSFGTPGVNSILVTTISNSSPVWGIDAVSVSGAASNAVSGDTVTVNWGDGNTTQIPISCAAWGPVLHTYSSSATSSNPNQIIATLVNSTNFVKATSTPSPVTVQKHTTKLSVTTLNSTSVKWGKKYSVTSNVLTDVTFGIPQPIAGKTITYGGNGTTGFPSGITNSTGGLISSVTITAPGIFNVGKGNIFAKFAGDSAYLQSSSSMTIQITKHVTALSNPTFSVPSVLWGKTFTVDSIITDTDRGVPINGSPLTFSGNGTVTKTDFSNSTGHTVTTLTATNFAGSGQVSAGFAGDGNYLPSNSGISAITLTKHVTALSNPTFDRTSVTSGDNFNADSVLTDSSNASSPVSGKQITYSGNGTSNPTPGITNSTGHAPTTLTASSSIGAGQVNVAFGGDNNYLPSNFGASSITITAHSFIGTASLSLNPATGSPNSQTIVNGTSFANSNSVTIKFDGVNQTTTTTDSGGKFSTQLTIPSSSAGQHTILAIDSIGNTASNNFTVVSIPAVTSSVNNTSPRWSMDSISASGNASNSVSGDTITVNWGDGTNSTGIPILSNSWGPVIHTYNSGSLATNPNQVIAKLVGNDNSVKATSVASSVIVRKHATVLSQPTLSIGSIKWGKTFTVTATQLTDYDAGGVGLAKTITYTGTGLTGIPTGTTTSGGILPGPVTITASTNVGTGKTVIANFTGDNLYLPSTSAAASIAINPHITALSKPTLSVATIKWAKAFAVKTTKLTDSDAGGAGILGETIKYAGTAVTGVPTGITNSSGSITGPVTITASTNVGTGKTVIANFTGDNLYLPSTSAAASIAINPHVTALTLGTLKNVAWGQSTSLPITLKDSDNAGSAIQGKLIHYDGTGVIGVSDMTTNSTGQAIGIGTAPTSVATGWSVQGHFAGDLLYVKSDSAIKTYNTLMHATTTSLTITPATVVHGQTYKVTGTLKDSTTGAVLSSKTITFTVTSPIVINPTTTTSTGAYSVTGLIAPSSGSYVIQAKFGGDSLYSSSISPNKTLTVTS